ncbi:hypothetical protein B4U79_18321 [Dinothrombium tinctorium]|uniref:CUB domain-containing protein n=1 Tax=Dinothrombium tinctorium TaxID=1965070 RepID=A0A443QQN8_9ACAR|nr:hypothetical protein B4U79_18321 [Dinothrombium tinctorium]
MNFKHIIKNWFHGWPVDESGRGDVKYGKQPSDDGYSNQNCVEIRNRFHLPSKGLGSTGEHYFWNDRFCNATNRFICQISEQWNDKPKDDLAASKNTENYCTQKTIELTQYHPWDTIVSPHYPELYPNNYNCTVTVKTIDDFVIELLFTDFLLEEGGER